MDHDKYVKRLKYVNEMKFSRVIKLWNWKLGTRTREERRINCQEQVKHEIIKIIIIVFLAVQWSQIINYSRVGCRMSRVCSVVFRVEQSHEFLKLRISAKNLMFSSNYVRVDSSSVNEWMLLVEFKWREGRVESVRRDDSSESTFPRADKMHDMFFRV